MEGRRWLRRLGFAVKVAGREGLKSNDARKWRSGPHLSVSIGYFRAILDYLDEIDVRMYRISSDFAPYCTHPEMPQFHGQVGECARDLADVGRIARERGIRLSLHPSQYVLLNALDPAITAKGIADVNSQAALLDAMEQGPEAVVVLHLGGAYGDKDAALKRFEEGYARLSEAGRRRLVIENDETVYTVQDCLRAHDATGVPLIFDHQHHHLNPGTMAMPDAARAALATWPAGVMPKVHFSSPKLDTRMVLKGGKEVPAPPLLSQHADYVHPWEFAAFLRDVGPIPFDVMLEAKMKDAALLKLRTDLTRYNLW
ncbi:MAG TPA: UV DNA damage repair endonuclease UvsE [Longimicrobiaceae bacterium]|jgi:UV DNA damage endonuclease|nr:UV DNA damage repair endonuclease UvsE [Longimicrobiaceae bacterium]